MGEIKVASCTVAELFSERIICSDNTEILGILEVPEYQRPYVWTKKEINKLLSDIKEHNCQVDKRLSYYLGSIILHKHEDILSIIDGQQRLTTLAIIQHIIDKNKAPVVPRVKYASPLTIEHIKNNHNHLKDCEGDWKNHIDFENINVTLVITDNEDDAYTFFETQNTGGVRLSGVDIIKAHHLREISGNCSRSEQYAITWEKQRDIDAVIKLLLKARRWNILNWIYVPSERDEKGIKQSIIKDFSEDTLHNSKKAAYNQIILKNDYSLIKISQYKFSIRQPIANGENFIDYLEQFSNLYQRLFKSTSNSDSEIHPEYYKFKESIVDVIDGTLFLKELYEITILCYVSKFGLDNLLEASLWIFRYTYSLRISSRKTVRENSVPAFLRDNHFVIDVILSSFNHEQLVSQLKLFSYEFNAENAGGNTVKARFINRVKTYFNTGESIITNFDELLKTGIDNKLNEGHNGK